jgi:hypothetical protein
MSQAAAAGSGSFTIVTGPSGIGKTTLLGAGAGIDTGLRVLSARGMPLERDFSFGIVRQLFEPVRGASRTADWDILLDGAARLARPVFERDSDSSGERDPHITTHGLYWLTANLAAREPLLIVVDDLHWADSPSLRWLSYLAARIDDLPTALLLAVQSGPGQPELVDELARTPSCALLTPRPLSPRACATLVRARLGRNAPNGPEPENTEPENTEPGNTEPGNTKPGNTEPGETGGDDPEPGDELCAACCESTGGNPFLLHSLLDTLCEARERGETTTTADVAAAAPGPVAAALLRRIRSLEAGPRR